MEQPHSDAGRVSAQLSALDEKITALESRFAPVAEQAKRGIDARLQNGIVPILRCIDTIKELRGGDTGGEQRLDFVANELETILEALGIERFELDTVDPLQQRVLDVRKTDRAELDGAIAQSVRAGYRQAGRVIRQQYVVLYKYEGVPA